MWNLTYIVHEQEHKQWLQYSNNIVRNVWIQDKVHLVCVKTIKEKMISYDIISNCIHCVQVVTDMVTPESLNLTEYQGKSYR